MTDSRIRQLASRTKPKHNQKTYDSGTIHPFLFMLGEFGEQAFGPEIIDTVATKLINTNASVLTRSLIEAAGQFFINEILRPQLKTSGVSLYDMPPFSEKTFMEYYTRFTTLERELKGSPFNSQSKGLIDFLNAYQIEEPFNLCREIVTFLHQNRDPIGFEDLIDALIDRIKKGSAPL